MYSPDNRIDNIDTNIKCWLRSLPDSENEEDLRL